MGHVLEMFNFLAAQLSYGIQFMLLVLGLGLVAAIVQGGRIWLLHNRGRVQALQREKEVLGKRLEQARDIEKSLRLSEERFRALVEGTQDWIWEVDASGVYTYVSPHVQDLLGYAPHEVLGKTPFDFMPTDQVAERRALFEEFVASRRPIDRLVSQALHRDGQTLYLETQGTPVLNDEDGLVGFRGIDRDITERVLAETALRRERDLMRSVTATSPSGIVMLDQEGRVFYGNAQAEAILGVSALEMLDRPFHEVTGPLRNFDGHLLSEEDGPFRRVLLGCESIVHMRYALHRSEGPDVLLAINAVPLLDTAGQVSGVVATMEDVTDQILDQARLEEGEKRFRNIVQSSPMGMYLYELNSAGELVLIEANAAADRMTGICNRDLLGKTIEEAFPALVGTEVPKRYRAAAEEGTSWHTSTLHYEDDHIKGAFDVYAFQTSPGRMVATFLEITDRVQVERALAESRNMLLSILDTIPIRVFWKDRECRYLGCNVAFAQDAGKSSPKEIIGLGDDSLSWQTQTEAYRAHDRHVMETGVSDLNDEIFQKRQGGSSCWLRVNKIPLRNANEEIIGVLGCYEDITERTQILEALRESEARFRRLAEHAPDMIYRMRLPDGHYEYMSPAATAVTGYSPQQWYDQPGLFSQILHPDWQDYFQQEWEKLLQGDVTPSYEFQIIDQKGEVRWLYQRNVLVRDEAEKPIAIEGIVTDVTERRRGADEIAKAQALLLTAIEQTPAGIIIADAPDATIRLVNSAALGIRGCDPVAVANIPMEHHPRQWKTYAPEGELYAPEQLPLSRAILQGETVANEELMIERDNGQRRWVLANAAPVRDVHGKIVAGIVVFPDITEQKRDLQRLRFTQFTVDQAKIAVFWCHADGRFFYVNEMACSWLQYTREELMQMHVADINPKFPQEDWTDHWQEIKDKGMVRMESVHQRKNGDVYPVEIYSNYVSFEGQAFNLAFVHNISERKRAEAALHKYREQLEELVQIRTTELQSANQELEAFVYSVSHDLRAPLRSMNGFSQAIVEDYGEQLDAVGKDYLNRIRKATVRMGHLIDDLLSLSRVTRTAMKYDLVDLTHLAQRHIANLQEEEPQRCVFVTIAPGLQAYGDSGLIEVLLQNLLGNAWKFTSLQQQACITFQMEEIEGEWVYCIQDNGAGFDMAYADKLFGVFQRLHAVHEFEGTGIGLASVQRIVYRHGGRIWAQSAPGQGATFFFTLARTADTIPMVSEGTKGRLRHGD